MLPLSFVNLVHIFQTPDHVALLHEEGHELRIIPLDGRPHVNPAIRLWRGDSRGHCRASGVVNAFSIEGAPRRFLDSSYRWM